MNENKQSKINLGMLISILIILVLVIALILVYYFGFVADQNENQPSQLNTNISNETINNDNTVDFEPAKYNIQFDARLLEDISEPYGNEKTEWDHTASFFEDNTFTIYMSWGNSIKGTYTVSNDIINCIITSAIGEYSPEQETTGKISFRIIGNSELEIIDVPETYTIRTSELTDSGWALTDETKEMRFWPLVKGIKFIAE